MKKKKKKEKKKKKNTTTKTNPPTPPPLSKILVVAPFPFSGFFFLFFSWRGTGVWVNKGVCVLVS